VLREVGIAEGACEMKKTYAGSCHCGAVRFEAEIDLAGETSRCNCSICMKSRFWKAVIPAGDLRVLQGEDQLADYQFGSGNIHHRFCTRCGVKTFGRGRHESIGEFYGVNVACLDNVPDRDWAAAPLVFQNGRENKWDSSPAETRHL
jgi:hypothetical protein